jgi:hypothetical protein
MNAESIWLRFRASNDLNHREAKYPESLIQHAVPIAVITLIEILGYTSFYRADGGLLDGFGIALMIAVANLVVFGGLGYASRYKNLKNSENFRKEAGIFAIMIAGFLVIFFNMVLALYRLTFSFSDAFSDTPSAIFGLLTGSSPFKNIEPFIMWFLGMAISIGAWYTGYTIDDAYPKYSEKDKNKNLYQKKYDEEISEIIPDEIVNQVIKQLDSITREANKLSDLQLLKEELIAKHASYQEREIVINHDLQVTISYFREHHQAIIAHGINTPVYFANPAPTIELTKYPTVDRIYKRIDELLLDTQKVKERITNTVIPTIHVINKNKPKIVLTAKTQYIHSIEESAQNSIHKQRQIQQGAS